MNDNTQQNSTDNTIPQEKTETTIEETNQVVENNVEQKQEDPNWRAFREARKKDRVEREAAERKAAEKEAEVIALKAAMEAAFAKDQRTTQYNEQNYSSNEESEDERIEKKVQAAIASREREYERQRIEREKIEYPQRLQEQFGDFNQTIANENLDYLDFHYPEISGPLSKMADGYDKWLYIYKNIKKFVPNNASARKDSVKADNNFNKPKSMSSTSITPPGETTSASRLTEERRAQNWERMQRALKGVS